MLQVTAEVDIIQDQVTTVLHLLHIQPILLREPCPEQALRLLLPGNVHQVTTGWPHHLTKEVGVWLTEEPTQAAAEADTTEAVLLPGHNVHLGLIGIVTITHVRQQEDRRTIPPAVMVVTPTMDRHPT